MKFRDFPGSNIVFNAGSRNLSDYAAETPLLDLREYLNGPLIASGVFIGLSGLVSRRFVISMEGAWNNNCGKLNEDFAYHDGEVGNRCWNLTFHDNYSFSMTAEDVEGIGKGAQCGNAAVMFYRLKIPRGQGEIIVTMEDWLYLMDDGTLINKARMSKFGLKVGEVIAAFYKDGSKSNAPCEKKRQWHL